MSSIGLSSCMAKTVATGQKEIDAGNNGNFYRCGKAKALVLRQWSHCSSNRKHEVTPLGTGSLSQWDASLFLIIFLLNDNT